MAKSRSLGFAYGLFFVFVAVSPAQPPALNQPVARTGDQVIDQEDLFPQIGARIFQLRVQEYELTVAGATNLVNQQLLEAEAKKQGTTVDLLLERNIDAKIPPPSAGEVEAYYLAQKDRIDKPLSDVRPQIERALLQARRQAAREAWLAQLRERAGFSLLVSRPTPEIAPDPLRLRGVSDAPVTIVEFADFQCPYCNAAQPVLKEVLERYRGKVRLGFRDFPLRQIHPQAQAAAEASRCAADQGRFWDYHDLLYANQSKLDSASLLEYARTAGLNTSEFSACLADGRFRQLIDADLQSGTIAGISGTPAFFINGVLLSGAQPASAFASVIDSELAKQDHAGH